MSNVSRMEGIALESAEMAKKAIGAAIDKQASDILMLDIKPVSDVADYFVICSAESERQIQAICDEIDAVLSKEGIKIYRREGTPGAGWVLLDYSQVVVHVFAPPSRKFYDLDTLWRKAITVVRVQ